MQRDVERDRVVRVLLAERTNGLRRLVWSLVRDDGLTEDVLQDTFVAAVEKPPRDPEAARAWLTTVAKNFVRLRFREESRRTRREARVAQPVALESHERQVDDRELREIVTECASAVPEPYRSTIVEIYYGGVSAKALARSLGVPESTVRVRKKRGLEFLRRELDRRVPGGRRQWIAGAIGWMGVDAASFDAVVAASPSSPPAIPSSSDAPAALGTVRHGSTVSSARIGHAVLIVGCLCVALWLSGVFEAPVATDPALGETAAQTNDTASFRQAGRPPGRVVPDSAAANPSGSGTHAALLRVVDGDGRPVAGASVFTDELSIPSERRSLGKSATEYLMLPFAQLPIGVTNSAGELHVPAELLGQQRLAVRAEGFREYRERARLRGHAGEALEYTVALAPAVRSSIRVVDAAGRPLGGVAVRCVGSSGRETTLFTDGAGEAEHVGVDHDVVLRIEDPGYVPHVRLLRAPVHTVTLIEGRATSGRVVTPRGEPAAGASVEIRILGHTSLPIVTTADEAGRFETPALPASGRVQVSLRHPEFPIATTEVAVPWTEERRFELSSGAWVAGRLDRVERFDGRELRAALVPVGAHGVRLFGAIGSDGAFRIGPVSSGHWALVVESPGGNTFPVVELPELRPGTLELGTLTAIEGITLEGRVVTPAGDPVAGVVLRVGSVVGEDVHGALVTTDADGRFAARGLPPEPPLVLDRRDDDRWNALGPRGDRERGWIVTVESPHQLLACHGEEVPDAALYGSRNSCRVDPRRTGWTLTVADPLTTAQMNLQPQWVSTTTDGRPIRTTTNLIVIPLENPSARSVIFAGTDGVPAVHFDPREWREAVVGIWTREYAVPFVRPPRDGAIVPVQLEVKRSRSVQLERTNGEPWAAAPILIEPVLAQRDTGFAVWLGRTDGEGRLDLSGIGSGHYRLRTWSDSDVVRKLGPPIATIVSVEETAELGAISWEPEQEGEWTLRVSDHVESRTATRLGSR